MLDLQADALLKQAAEQGAPDIADLPPEQCREFFKDFIVSVDAKPADIQIDNQTIPGPASNLDIRIYTPNQGSNKKPVLIYYHGGGWVIGGLDAYEGLCSSLATKSGCIVVAVDYRLAPEHKFPAGLEDCITATHWAAANAESFGGDPSRLAVAGDSAGGNLTIVTTNALTNDPADVPVLIQAPIYPVASDITKHESFAKFADGYLLTGSTMAWFTKQYAGDPADPRNTPMVGDCSNTPPTVLCTAGLDPLRDSGREYAAHLIQQGTEVAYFEFPGIIHGFTTLRKAIPSGQKDVEAFLAAIRNKLDRIKA